MAKRRGMGALCTLFASSVDEVVTVNRAAPGDLSAGDGAGGNTAAMTPKSQVKTSLSRCC
jgi:hypothetical protein